MTAFRRPGGGLLRISEHALATIEPYRQRRSAAPEAGGVLLGRLIVERPDVVVDAVTVPSRWDRWSRFGFVRAASPTQRAISRAWENSTGEQNYLGEWHTHPEDDPTPSGVDLSNWDRLARDARFEQDALFFVIAGRAHIRAWEMPQGGGRATPLVALATTPETPSPSASDPP